MGYCDVTVLGFLCLNWLPGCHIPVYNSEQPRKMGLGSLHQIQDKSKVEFCENTASAHDIQNCSLATSLHLT